jgi:hypothetical protein
MEAPILYFRPPRCTRSWKDGEPTSQSTTNTRPKIGLATWCWAKPLKTSEYSCFARSHTSKEIQCHHSTTTFRRSKEGLGAMLRSPTITCANDIRQLWAIEQTWQGSGKGALLHRQVFMRYIVPKLTARRDYWDNLSIDAEPLNATSLDDCHVACQTKSSCLQYKYAAGQCFTSEEIRLGDEASKSCLDYSVAASKCIRWQEWAQDTSVVQSGWMLDRLPQYIEEMDSLCDGEEDVKWVV